MKKIFLASTYLVLALALLSCEADSVVDSNQPVQQVFADANGDSVPVPGGDTPGEGPEDDVIVIKPPKKP